MEEYLKVTISLFFFTPSIAFHENVTRVQTPTDGIAMLVTSTTTSLTKSDEDLDSCYGLTFQNFISKLDEQWLSGSDNIMTYPLELNRTCYCTFTGQSQGTFLIPGLQKCPIRCPLCESNTTRCRIQDICCPDTDTKQAISPNIRPKRVINECLQLERGQYYLVTRSCPVDYDDDVTRALCEDELSREDTSLATLVVVTDEATGVTYFNRYCALCNNVTQVREWIPVLHCYHAVPMISALTKEEYYKLSMYKNEACFIRQHHIGINNVVECWPQHYTKNPVISSCNVTGKEIFYTNVEDLCTETPSTVHTRVVHGNEVYKNIHCLLCNSELAKSMTRRDCLVDVGLDRAPFKFLFGLDNSRFGDNSDSSSSSRADAVCESNQWLDPGNNCRRLECTAGKILQGNYCETALVEEIKGLPYRTGLFLVPQRHSFHSPDTMRQVSFQDVSQAIADAIKQLVTPFSERLAIYMGVHFAQELTRFPLQANNSIDNRTESFVEQTFLMPKEAWMKIYIVTRMLQTRDDVENGILEALNSSVISVQTGESYITEYKIQFIHEASFDLNSSCDSFSNTSACHTFSATYALVFSDNTLRMSGKYLSVKLLTFSDFVEMLPYLTCPYVVLQNEEVQETIDMLPIPHVTKVTLLFGSFKYEIVESGLIDKVTRRNNGQFYACVDMLRTINLHRHWQSALERLFITVQYSLTIVCVAISWLCLSATVMTYILFPSLRNVAGCNTLGLSCSLMIAQILLFIANEITGPSIVCTTIGIIVHYSWLVMFSWMFLCCLNVLKVFSRIRAQPRNNPRQDKKVISTNLMSSLLVPALIIILTIVTHVIIYEGERLGYGDKTCAMDSPFAIHVPLIFVIACNIVFYVVVVCKIWGVRRLKGLAELGKQDRNDFVIYIKLSTLTGMFWLLVVLGEVFNDDIVRCFAVIMNGCQGIFIFASFIVNQRVMNLYREKFNLESPEVPRI